MRMRKLRGPHMKKSMPFEPFRTRTQPVNLSDLSRFDDGAEVTPESLRAKGLATRKRVPVKILARGELERKNLVVSAHGFSAKARESIEAAGGTLHGRSSTEEPPSDRHHRQLLQRPGDPAKIFFTPAILALYRLGAYIPVPGIDLNAVEPSTTSSTGRTSSAS